MSYPRSRSVNRAGSRPRFNSTFHGFSFFSFLRSSPRLIDPPRKIPRFPPRTRRMPSRASRTIFNLALSKTKPMSPTIDDPRQRLRQRKLYSRCRIYLSPSLSLASRCVFAAKPFQPFSFGWKFDKGIFPFDNRRPFSSERKKNFFRKANIVRICRSDATRALA